MYQVGDDSTLIRGITHFINLNKSTSVDKKDCTLVIV